MFKSVRLQQEREWYEIRDTFCGQNGKQWARRNVVIAFELAKKSEHPKAKWLVSVLQEVDDLDNAKLVYATLYNTGNLEAQLLAASLKKQFYDIVYDLARKGCILAAVWWSDSWDQAIIAFPKKFETLNMADQDRDLYALRGANDTPQKIKWLEIAKRLGSRNAASHLLRMFEPTDALYWKHIAFFRSRWKTFHLQQAETRLVDGRFPPTRADFLAIGKQFAEFVMCSSEVHKAKDIYKEHVVQSKASIAAFLFSARRLGICKDLRKLIGRLIWISLNDV